MKKQFTWFGIIAAIVIGISTCFVGCNTEINDVVNYHGQVVYINTTTPFPDLTVKVTDGHNIHCQTQTNAGGLFSLTVRVSEIDANYYLLVGDSTCTPKIVRLGESNKAEVDLGVIEVEGPELPTVVTTQLLSVKANEAVLGGEVLTDGHMMVTARGICYSQYPNPTIDGLHTIEGSGQGTFTSTLQDLEYNTTYYARAYATNKIGTAYGEQVIFTTLQSLPTETTEIIINVTATTAKGGGNVTSNGASVIITRGICWSSTTSTPTLNDDHTDDGADNGAFTSYMTGLFPSTTYYVRAYATNEFGTSYGSVVTFTTTDGLPYVTTDMVSNIESTTAQCKGTIISDGGYTITACGVCWSANSSMPTLSDEFTSERASIGIFNSQLTNLSANTTYYVRAYASNEFGTVYGNVMIFTTAE